MDFNPFKHKISELSSISAGKGNLLIAEPFMQDPYFKRSVVLLCEHSNEGIVGFILNQSLGIKLSEVMPDISEQDFPVFLGGPVSPQNLFFLHRFGELPGCLQITDELYWDGDFEILKMMLQKGEVMPEDIRFFLGYSGWDFDQLSNEIENQSWLINQLNMSDIFEINPDHLWKHAVKSMKKKQATILAEFPEDPTLN